MSANACSRVPTPMPLAVGRYGTRIFFSDVAAKEEHLKRGHLADLFLQFKVICNTLSSAILNA